MHHEARALTGGGIPAEEEKEEGEEAKRATEKAVDDAVEEQKALKTAEEDKKALGLSKARVTELEVRTSEFVGMCAVEIDSW